MASSLLLLFLISLPFVFALTEDSNSLLSSPNMADCGPRLLPLAPCAPFVQGSVPSPVQPCCNNLKNLYDQLPNCLCILFNDSAISAFPINKTLALELPVLCNLQVNISICPGAILTPTSPESQFTNGTNATTLSAVSPTTALAPRSNMGFGIGFGRSAANEKLKVNGASLVLAAITFLFMEVFIAPDD